MSPRKVKDIQVDHRGLTLDGGGVFGIGQALILSQVSSLDKFEFVAGTSIGAVIAAVVATRDAEQLRKLPEFFYKQLPAVFSGYFWRHYCPFTPRYNDKALNAALQSLFPTQYMRDLKIPTFITGADLNQRQLKVFYSGDSQDGALPVWEVLRMAVAAETYFAPFNGIADGGIFSNNPVMVGIAAAQQVLKMPSESMRICSIGTGESSYNTNIGTTNGWTVIAWGSYLLSALLCGASSKMHAYFAQQMGLKEYLRIQFMREDAWHMDCPTDMTAAAVKWAPAINDGISKVEAF